MRTISNAPTTKPPNQILRNGLLTTYIIYKPKTLKDGKVVFHKHSHTYERKVQRKKRVQTGKYKQLKTHKANELKKSILEHMDKFSLNDLDYIIERFKQDPEGCKICIMAN
jgi:hypothetical protein